MKEIYSIVDIIFKAVHIGDVFEVLIFVFWRCLCLIMIKKKNQNKIFDRVKNHQNISSCIVFHSESMYVF